MSNRTRRLCAGMLAAVLSIALAACGGIPREGSVQSGPSLGELGTGDFVFNPLSPAVDADQRSILEGFIAAFSGTQSDYAVARQYLSADFKKEWDPRKSVLVRVGAPVYRSTDAFTMEYSFTTKAQVDEFGAYSPTPAASQTLEFTFVQEDGQWRISHAPAGIVLSESTFLTVFSKHSLYFYDLSLDYLVPDQRWFPGGTTATRIVSALLAGPPAWLKGAVVSQFPDGTQLTPGTTVTIDSTVAQVDLTPEAATADERQRQLMELQLSASLSAVPAISGVEVFIAGSLLNIPPMSDSPQAQSRVDARPLVQADGVFGFYSAGEITPIEQLSEKVVSLGATAATLGVTGNVAVVQAPNGTVLVRSGQTPPAVVDARAGLIAPSLDNYGFVWSVPRDAPGQILAFDFDGAAFPVAATMPPGSQVVSLDVSRDNTRIAILLQTASGPRLIVAAILRDTARKFAPTSIGDPVLDIALGSNAAIDATWMDELTIAALTRSGDQDTVTTFEIGGQVLTLGQPEPATQIVGGNSLAGLRLLGEDHVVRAPRGSTWQKTQAVVDFIATQR